MANSADTSADKHTKSFYDRHEHLIGQHPKEIELDELRSMGHPETPMKAIRSKCLDCVGGSEKEVRLCTVVACPLWPYRMGRNPFYGKR